MSTKPIKVRSEPGIKRDGTRYEGRGYIDGQWVRFQRGLPRKMGGYQSISSAIPEIARGINSYSGNGSQYVVIGGASSLSQAQIQNGSLTALVDRVPAGLAVSSDNLWQFDYLFDTVATTTQLCAHAAPNLIIDSTVDEEIWVGDVFDVAILVDSGMDPVSGGIVALGPYLVAYGNFGYVGWSDANNVSATLDFSNITQQKIVKGLPLRGTGGGPAGLLWSLDSLVRMTFNDPLTVTWNFDTLAADISVLSSQAIVQYDGIYYWPGVDRILMFNGVVRELPNDMNINFFYDNLNFTQRQKVFGFTNPRWGEIWWCFPFGNATECTNAIIYNVRENTWYDTLLPDLGRSAGIYPKVYNRPFMVGAVDTGTNQYVLWQHEVATDRIDGSSVQPIPSFFETGEISMLEQGDNKALRVDRIEPDFIQTGEMTVQVSGRQNTRAPVVSGNELQFEEPGALTPQEETVKMKVERRLLSFIFRSNTVGGNYEMGETMVHVEPADGRVQS